MRVGGGGRREGFLVGQTLENRTTSLPPDPKICAGRKLNQEEVWEGAGDAAAYWLLWRPFCSIGKSSEDADIAVPLVWGRGRQGEDEVRGREKGCVIYCFSSLGSGPLVPYPHGNFAGTACQPHTHTFI